MTLPRQTRSTTDSHVAKRTRSSFRQIVIDPSSPPASNPAQAGVVRVAVGRVVKRRPPAKGVGDKKAAAAQHRKIKVSDGEKPVTSSPPPARRSGAARDSPPGAGISEEQALLATAPARQGGSWRSQQMATLPHNTTTIGAPASNQRRVRKITTYTTRPNSSPAGSTPRRTLRKSTHPVTEPGADLAPPAVDATIPTATRPTAPTPAPAESRASSDLDPTPGPSTVVVRTRARHPSPRSSAASMLGGTSPAPSSSSTISVSDDAPSPLPAPSGKAIEGVVASPRKRLAREKGADGRDESVSRRPKDARHESSRRSNKSAVLALADVLALSSREGAAKSLRISPSPAALTSKAAAAHIPLDSPARSQAPPASPTAAAVASAASATGTSSRTLQSHPPPLPPSAAAALSPFPPRHTTSPYVATPSPARRPVSLSLSGASPSRSGSGIRIPSDLHTAGSVHLPSLGTSGRHASPSTRPRSGTMTHRNASTSITAIGDDLHSDNAIDGRQANGDAADDDEDTMVIDLTPPVSRTASPRPAPLSLSLSRTSSSTPLPSPKRSTSDQSAPPTQLDSPPATTASRSRSRSSTPTLPPTDPIMLAHLTFSAHLSSHSHLPHRGWTLISPDVMKNTHAAETYWSLAAYDDVCSHVLLDTLYLAFRTRKMTFHHPGFAGLGDVPHRIRTCPADVKVPTATVAEIVRRFAADEISLNTAVHAVIACIPWLRTWLTSQLALPHVRHFTRHMRRYMSMYAAHAGVDLTECKRYPSAAMPPATPTSACSTSMSNASTTAVAASAVAEWGQAMLVATRTLYPGHLLPLCTAQLAKVSRADAVVVEAHGADFSVIESGKLGSECLLAGPTLFANHDCHPNAQFLPYGPTGVMLKVLREIKVGEEVLVKYGERYFGAGNSECLCESCEREEKGAFRPQAVGHESSVRGNEEQRRDDQGDVEMDVNGHLGDARRSTRPSTFSSSAASTRPPSRAESLSAGFAPVPPLTSRIVATLAPSTAAAPKLPPDARAAIRAKLTTTTALRTYLSRVSRLTQTPTSTVPCLPRKVTCAACKCPTYVYQVTDQGHVHCDKCVRHALVFARAWPARFDPAAARAENGAGGGRRLIKMDVDDSLAWFHTGEGEGEGEQASGGVYELHKLERRLVSFAVGEEDEENKDMPDGDPADGAALHVAVSPRGRGRSLKRMGSAGASTTATSPGWNKVTKAAAAAKRAAVEREVREELNKLRAVKGKYAKVKYLFDDGSEVVEGEERDLPRVFNYNQRNLILAWDEDKWWPAITVPVSDWESQTLPVPPQGYFHIQYCGSGNPYSCLPHSDLIRVTNIYRGSQCLLRDPPPIPPPSDTSNTDAADNAPMALPAPPAAPTILVAGSVHLPLMSNQADRLFKIAQRPQKTCWPKWHQEYKVLMNDDAKSLVPADSDLRYRPVANVDLAKIVKHGPPPKVKDIGSATGSRTGSNVSLIPLDAEKPYGPVGVEPPPKVELGPGFSPSRTPRSRSAGKNKTSTPTRSHVSVLLDLAARAMASDHEEDSTAQAQGNEADKGTPSRSPVATPGAAKRKGKKKAIADEPDVVTMPCTPTLASKTAAGKAKAKSHSPVIVEVPAAKLVGAKAKTKPKFDSPVESPMSSTKLRGSPSARKSTPNATTKAKPVPSPPQDAAVSPPPTSPTGRNRAANAPVPSSASPRPGMRDSPAAAATPSNVLGTDADDPHAQDGAGAKRKRGRPPKTTRAPQKRKAADAALCQDEDHMVLATAAAGSPAKRAKMVPAAQGKEVAGGKAGASAAKAKRSA